MVNQKGKVKIKGAGTAKVLIYGSETENYHKTETAVVVNVSKKDQKLKVNKKAFSVPLSDIKQKIEATSDGSGKITFEVKDKKIAKIEKDGSIVPLAEGKTEITVKQEGTKNLNGAEVKIPVEITKPTASDFALAAVAWARDIANDNSFNYGTKPASQHKGCYFCGTERKCKGKYVSHWSAKWEKTYCCNTFCFSAYAHGAQIPSMLSDCKAGHNAAWGNEWTKYGFENLGKLKYSQLQPGDVITAHKHMWMISDPEKDLCVESTGGGWGADSIYEHSGAKSKYSNAYFVLRLK